MPNNVDDLLFRDDAKHFGVCVYRFTQDDTNVVVRTWEWNRWNFRLTLRRRFSEPRAGANNWRHSRLAERRPDLRAALAAAGAGEVRLDVRQPKPSALTSM